MTLTVSDKFGPTVSNRQGANSSYTQSTFNRRGETKYFWMLFLALFIKNSIELSSCFYVLATTP